MKKLIILAMLLAMSSTTSFAKQAPEELEIDTSKTINMRTIALGRDGIGYGTANGTIIGLSTAPKCDYQVNITNGKGYKHNTFNMMICNLLPLKEINYQPGVSIPLSTQFEVDGEVYTAIGFYSGSMAMAIDGYKVIIKNGKNHGEWNTMNCKISK